MNILIKQFNELVSTTNSIDFQIESLNDGNLKVIGGFDLSYHHEIELVFKQVSFISLPSEFIEPQLEIAEAAEIEQITKELVFKDQDTLFRINAQTPIGLNTHQFYVIAQSIQLHEGTVLHY